MRRLVVVAVGIGTVAFLGSATPASATDKLYQCGQPTVLLVTAPTKQEARDLAEQFGLDPKTCGKVRGQ